MNFSEIIKEIMIENKLSQEKLAKEIGVNQTTVGMWLSGKKKPSYDSIVLICKKFDISGDEILGLK